MAAHKVQVIPIVTASSAYTAGDVVGDVLTFSNIFPFHKSGNIVAVGINFSGSAQTTDFNVTLYSDLPTGTYTDQGAPSPNTGDYPLILTKFVLQAANNYSYNSISSFSGIPLVSRSKDLYGVITCVGTPTFATASDVIISLLAEW